MRLYEGFPNGSLSLKRSIIASKQANPNPRDLLTNQRPGGREPRVQANRPPVERA